MLSTSCVLRCSLTLSYLLMLIPWISGDCTNKPRVDNYPWSVTSDRCDSAVPATWDLSISDADGDLLTVDIVSTDPEVANGFRVDSGGTLYCSQTEIEAANHRDYVLNISATDGCNTIYFTHSVNFTNILASTNLYDPVITPESVNVTGNLFVTAGGASDVATLTVTDDDAGADGTIDSVTITGNPDNAPFTLSSADPYVLRLTGSLDTFSNQISLTIQAIDQGTPPRTGVITFTVYIENPPYFNSLRDGDILYFCEDFAAGDVIANLTHVNPGGSVTTYTITSQEPASPLLFEANATSEELLVAAGVADGSFDVDAAGVITQYNVTISVSDGSTSSSIKLILVVDDVNDNTPEITGVSDQNIIESTLAGSPIFDVTTTDGDRDAPNNEVTLSLSGTNSDHFVLDGSTLKLADPSPLNYTSVSEYNLVLTATDGADPGDQLTSNVSFRIAVMTAPEFSSATYQLEMPENKVAGDTVFEMTASDRDGDLLIYTISNNESFFTSTGSTIQVASGVTEANFDVDTGTKSYQVNLTVSDGTYTDTAVLTINVVDYNDNPPVFAEASYTHSMNENTPAGTSILTVAATDDDIGAANKLVTFSISGTDSAHFEIGGASGVISVASPSSLNYSVVPAYTLIVTATDGGDPALSATVTASVTIETSPEFTSATYELEIPENKVAGDTVFEMTANDRDGSSLTYTISNNEGFFTSTGSTIQVASGVTEANFDVDTGTKSYQVNLTVSDGTYIDTAVLTINVVDFNDNTPVFAEASYTHSMNENTPAGTSILTVAATDDDIGAANKLVTFSISGTESSHFEIDGTSGVITVASPSMLNYTEVQDYNLTVTATDGGDPVLSSSVTVSVTIESSPSLVRPLSGEDPTQIVEDKAAGTLVYTFVTDDKDTPSADLTYTIDLQVPSTPVLFEIVNDKLMTKTDMSDTDLNVDGAAAVTLYTFTVSVTDGKYSDTGEVKIQVLDTNDETPVFTDSGQYTAAIEETATGVIKTVSASDSDLTSPNNDVYYSLIAGNVEGLFVLDTVTGNISLTKDVKELQYTLRVTATDWGSPANTATATVVVKVNKDTVNECNPMPCWNGATCRANVNYFFCDCAVGWDGAMCKHNIDDCDPDPCANGGVCIDGVAGYTCDCEPGWGGTNCTSVCVDNTYGRNCNQSCSCNDTNIADDAQEQRCDVSTGVCHCNTHWTGPECNQDAAECSTASSALCTAANTACSDTIGSYECVCKTGYMENSAKACVEESFVDDAKGRGNVLEIVVISLDVNECPDLANPTVYLVLKIQLETQLKGRNLGINLYVYNIICGSVKFEVSVETANTSQATINLAQKLKDLRNDGKLNVGDQEALVQNMTVNSQNVPVDNRLCAIYESLTTCGESYECREEDGMPYCREVKDENTDVILGVGIGVGVFLVLLCGIIITALVLRSRKRSARALRKDRHTDYGRERRPYNSRKDDRYGDQHDDSYNSRHGDRHDDPYSYSKHGSRMYDNRSQDYKNPYIFTSKPYE